MTLRHFFPTSLLSGESQVLPSRASQVVKPLPKPCVYHQHCAAGVLLHKLSACICIVHSRICCAAVLFLRTVLALGFWGVCYYHTCAAMHLGQLQPFILQLKQKTVRFLTVHCFSKIPYLVLTGT